jgi:hypothetical protein
LIVRSRKISKEGKEKEKGISIMSSNIDQLASILDRIDSSKQPKLHSTDTPNTTTSSSATIVQVIKAEEWFEYLDPTSGKYYYHNYKTNETKWDKPDSFVPYSVPSTTSDIGSSSGLAGYSLPSTTTSADYTVKAYFNQQDGRFGATGVSNYWEQVSMTSFLSFS